MASGPITSCQIDAETMESDRLYFFGSKISAGGDCSHKIKRRLLPGRKAMTNLDSILKSKQKQKILRRGGKNTQKNCTKRIFTTQIMMMM